MKPIVYTVGSSTHTEGGFCTARTFIIGYFCCSLNVQNYFSLLYHNGQKKKGWNIDLEFLKKLGATIAMVTHSFVTVRINYQKPCVFPGNLLGSLSQYLLGEIRMLQSDVIRVFWRPG